MQVLKALEHLETARHDIVELGLELKKLLQPYLEESGAETLADTAGMTVQQLRNLYENGVQDAPLAQLMRLAWALDHNLRLDLVPHHEEH